MVLSGLLLYAFWTSWRFDDRGHRNCHTYSLARNAIQFDQTCSFRFYSCHWGLLCQLGNNHPFHCVWHESIRPSALSQLDSKVSCLSLKISGSRLFNFLCVLRSYRSGFYRGISCPYAHLITYLSTRHDKDYGLHFKEMCMRIFCQICGGLWAYKLNQTAWNLYLTPTHWYQSYNTSYGVCLTFLNVSTTYGFLIGNIKR